MTQVRTDRDAAALARHLVDPGRRWPVVVVSIHPDSAEPYLDAADLAKQLEDTAAVVLMGADASFGLTDALGDRRLSVFYGAGRVYPPGTAWTRDMYAAPLHLCLSRSQGRRVLPEVAADALSAALAAGLLQRPEQQASDEHVTVKVTGTFGPAHARVSTDKRETAVMRTAHLGSDLPADRLVRPGHVLTGRLRRTRGLWHAFLPDDVADDPVARAHAQLPDGSITLAQVAQVAGHEATLLLHPRVPVLVDTGEDDAAVLLQPGDVVAVEVVWDDGRAHGAMLGDTSDVALVPAIGVLPGGPPWLTEAAAQPPALPEPVEHVEPEAGPAPPEPGELDVDEARRQLRTARDANEVLTEQLTREQTRIADLQAQVRTLRDQLRKAVSKRNRSSFAPVYRDPERQLRYEIEQAYLQRIPEDDRDRWPLPGHYRVGPAFVDSLQALQGVSRDKVLDVLVECLVGLDRELSGRQRHPWLVRRGGNQLARDDGAVAWRVSLQANTPGARRLKYWTRQDGTIELDSVGHHDAGLA